MGDNALFLAVAANGPVWPVGRQGGALRMREHGI